MTNEERQLLLEIGMALGALLESHTRPDAPNVFEVRERFVSMAAPLLMQLASPSGGRRAPSFAKRADDEG